MSVSSLPPAGWRFWIDRGGTFTDVVAIAPNGTWHSDKLLSSNPQQYADAASEGIQRLLQRYGHSPQTVTEIRLGTTVATNALLERRGAPVALVLTIGFADLPIIRHQDRPSLFQRHLERPPPLFTQVIEARERVSASGEVHQALDGAALTQLRRDLIAARAAGIEAVAICFLHGWAHPAHEQVAAAAACDAGFTQVFTSHTVSPLPRWVPRADTTVANAYLTPVLQRYTEAFTTRIAPLAATEVAFMQSHGGLTSAAHFRGVDALLSGPAGGLVGLQGVGAAIGQSRLIGCDMGGTSTDVALVDGSLPRRAVNPLAGLTLQVPMLDIHTIAAGGGSVLAITDGRLTVGPVSAGADPGPCCYRRGGPLTVTDANVLLGRLVPERFPSVFGPQSDQPFDVAAVSTAFSALASSLAPTAPSLQSLAEDFLSVAVGAMANAVRHVALRAGHDPAEFTLVPFGGAGGQHACQIAAALGISQVLIHPLASVLSAVGIGLAPRRAVRRRGEGRTLAALESADLTQAFSQLQREALEALTTIAPATWGLALHLRVPGTDATLAVDWHVGRSTTQVVTDFIRQYTHRYGFTPTASDVAPESLIVDALEVEAMADAARVLPDAATPTRALHPPCTTTAWFSGSWHTVPLLDRAALLPDSCISGPALMTDDGATTVLLPGWQARVLAQGELWLTPIAGAVPGVRQPLPGVDTAPTPARLEIFNGLYQQVAEQMGLVLCDAARSVNVKERLDFSCAVFAADGSLVANAPHMPVHLGSMGASVRAIQTRLLARGTPAQAGDAWLVNVPWGGGTHLPDITAVSPVLLDGDTTPRFWVASRAHHADLGGLTPGSMPPNSTTIEEEGITFDGFPVVIAGVFQDAALRAQLLTGRWPARNVEQNVADVRAQLAANARGILELRRLCQQHGAAQISAYMHHVQDNAAAAVRAAIGALTPGECSVPLDAGMVVRVRIDVDRVAGTARIDFTGTSAQNFPQPHNFHAPLAVTTAAVLYVFRTLIDRDLPLNEGCLRPLTLVVPEGSLLNPRPGAAVVAGNVETSQAVVDALYGALGLLAASQGTMNNLTFGDETHQYYETIAGGAGAGPGFPGADGIQTHMTNSRITDPEILEQRFPVRLEHFGFRPGSGGRGQWPGGKGLIRTLRFLAPMTVGLLSQRRLHAPFGVAGGGDAATGTAILTRLNGPVEVLGACATVTVKAGDQLCIATPGGGGYGPEPTTTPTPASPCSLTTR